ncbi:MAG: hypothetical protein ACI8RP_001191 [Urechidicola sp.]|jgi:hypothetical protein
MQQKYVFFNKKITFFAKKIYRPFFRNKEG